MLPTKVVVIGAGSASFGLNTVAALLHSQRLRGSHIALVDRNPDNLSRMARLAARLNREWDAGMTLTSHMDHRDALDGAQFVVSAIEVPPREELWRSDYELTLKHGVRQPYAENGGPGGFAHALRNIGPVLEIAHAMEAACPDAWFINYTNPMIRICDAVARYSRIRVVGLCHQIYEGYGMIGAVLADHLGIDVPPGRISTDADPEVISAMHHIIRQAVQKIHVRAAGLNHFTWVLDVRDRRTGEDLYPLLRERWQRMDPAFEPLTAQVTRSFGVMPVPGDQHLCEYLPWLSDPATRPWERYNLALYKWELRAQDRERGHARITAMADGVEGIERLQEADSEGALEVIENIAGAGSHFHLAVNVPNRGNIGNLPDGAIVEVPGVVSGAGIHGVAVGDLPEPVAELCRRETTVARLCVDAAALGDRAAALQCLLLDPVIRDMDTAERILADYLDTYREHLPQFWR